MYFVWHVIVYKLSATVFCKLSLHPVHLNWQDLPYLDLNASPPKSRSQSDDKFEEEDKVSLCSMQSFASRNSLSAVSISNVSIIIITRLSQNVMRLDLLYQK